MNIAPVPCKDVEMDRKTITVQLPADLVNTLNVCKKTDTLSAYVERLILAGLKNTTDDRENSEIVRNDSEDGMLENHDWDADQKKFTDGIEKSKYRYVQMLAESGNTAGTIAKKLSIDGYPPLTGKTRWTAATVRSILKSKKHDV